MQKLLIYLLLILVLVSCEEHSEWDLKTANNNFVVVDGIITNEFRFQTLTIFKPVGHLNEKAQPVSNAVVLVSSDQQVYSFEEDTANKGTYISDKKFTGIRNRTYSLLITWENKVYSAKAVLEPPVLLTAYVPVKYEKNNNNDKYQLTKIPNTYNPLLPAMYEITLDWSGVPGYENDDFGSTHAKLYFYTLPTIDVSEVFAPGLEKVYFPAGTILTQRRYSLTFEHAAFLRALLLETTWSGGYFNTASANLPTNMSEGAMGFFAACGVTEKTEVVK